MIGEEAPVAEAEIALMIWKALKEMNCGEETAELIVNATGCSQCRPQFRSAFLAYFRSRAARICKDCKRDLKAAPTRVLLCKEERCAFLASHAPQILDYICERCKRHLKGFLEFLDEVEVPYFLDAKLFREGSWFNALVFEFAADAESLAEERSGGTARTQKERLILAEGGRISRAGELIVGKACSAVCGTLFLDAVEEVSIRKGVAFPDLQKPKVFLAQLGEFAKRKSLRMLEVLRVHGIEARETLGRDSIKAQLKVAEHMGVQIALILGQKEAIDETIIIREMESGIQEIIPQEKLVEFLMRKLRK